MHLLDAGIAFALTLAFLATLVTVLMEGIVRLSQQRKRNLIKMLRKLNEELPQGLFRADGPLALDAEARWQFAVKVLNNPLAPPAHQHAVSDQRGSVREPGAFFLGRGCYDKVSLEHLLRRLAECEVVQRAATDAADALRAEFDRLARKYQEFGAAVAVQFKRRAATWSIVLGVMVAIAGNIDGLRIFEAYKSDRALTERVIAQEAAFSERAAEAREREAGLRAVVGALGDARATLADPSSTAGERAAAEEIVARQNAALESLADPAAIEQTLELAQATFTDLVALGVPVGWDYYPNCVAAAQAAGRCRALLARHPHLDGVVATLWADTGQALVWLLKALVTGLLIGLGAPFWFDVAKRLAQVRSMFSGRGSAESRTRGADPLQDVGERDRLIERVVADTARQASMG